MRRRLFWIVGGAVVLGCQDPAQAPLPLAVAMQPTAQTAGGIVTLTSQQFQDIGLVPRIDSVPRPNRWANFRVTIGTDTADSWRTGPTEMAFRVPPVYTGNYDVRVWVEGHDAFSTGLYAVGQAYPILWGGLQAYTNVHTGTAFPPFGFLIGESWMWPGFKRGYGLIDIQGRRLRMFPEMTLPSGADIKIDAPGPSYRTNHFVFDFSPINVSARPKVWDLNPPIHVVDSIPCVDPRGFYAAADLAGGICLLRAQNGALIRNGVDTVVPIQAAFFDGQFRMAAGGRWTAVTTGLFNRQYYEPYSTIWPVFDQAGNVAYTIDTLFHVSGAAFSRYGDTMYAAVSVRDDLANYYDGRFSVVMLETATGRTLAVKSFPTERVLQDVLVDPIRPFVYVAGMEPDAYGLPYSFHNQRQYLTVLDRRTLDVVADIPAAEAWSVGDATLVYGGSSGRIHVLAWCGFDCGGIYGFAFDLP